MNTKECGRNLSWSDFKVISLHLPGGTEENDDDPQFTRSELSEYEVGMLTTRPQHSVISYSEV
jgi:hypothetical protein